MKKKFYAQVEMKITRQVEVECDESLTNGEIKLLAIVQAEKEYGEYDDIEVVEMDYA